jgi:hypothetical protein
LIHSAKLPRPLAILLGSVCPNLPYISNDWKASRTLEASEPSIVPFNLGKEDVEKDVEEQQIGQSRKWMFPCESSKFFNPIGKHVD